MNKKKWWAVLIVVVLIILLLIWGSKGVVDGMSQATSSEARTVEETQAEER